MPELITASLLRVLPIVGFLVTVTVLPVSNLTNLLALSRFRYLGVSHAEYVVLAALPGWRPSSRRPRSSSRCIRSC